MGVPPRDVACEVTRHGWLAEITVHDHGGLLDVATMEQTWSRVLAQRPTKIVVIDMTHVGSLDEGIARWLIDSQRSAASMDVELVVLAPRGEAREKLRRHAVGSVVTLVDPL
jgi:anti-anti-sigma regulatory factor